MGLNTTCIVMGHRASQIRRYVQGASMFVAQSWGLALAAV